MTSSRAALRRGDRTHHIEGQAARNRIATAHRGSVHDTGHTDSLRRDEDAHNLQAPGRKQNSFLGSTRQAMNSACRS